MQEEQSPFLMLKPAAHPAQESPAPAAAAAHPMETDGEDGDYGTEPSPLQIVHLPAEPTARENRRSSTGPDRSAA